ncbi:uncharacterized protein C7orf57 homolog [Protobothrops mucrosquamatus]|uniref:uncharacterized protein C7orf57 homolog n=1 Tax=Protobothrops mucrosquamatus TaxID=103944 RepID=UPI000775ED8C|nr:uncharacterized protein C7orf57 homolog [Protobothrops mucrosquamatus]
MYGCGGINRIHNYIPNHKYLCPPDGCAVSTVKWTARATASKKLVSSGGVRRNVFCCYRSRDCLLLQLVEDHRPLLFAGATRFTSNFPASEKALSARGFVTSSPTPGATRDTDDDWYYHIPLKHSEEQVSSEVAQQPMSEIRCLGDFGDPHNDITFGGRRKWIKDTDSEYVKLAKQGGQPDLLRHFTPTPRKVSLGPYGALEWYSHHSKQAATDYSKPHVPAMPDYMIHEEFKTDQSSSYKPKMGPFDFDMKSVWQRDAEDKENKEKREIKLPAIPPRYPRRTHQAVTSKEFHGGNRLYFPPMPAHKKNEPINFSKLISSGYGDEWLQERDQWEKKNTEPNDSFLPPNSETSQPELIQTEIE